MTAVTETDNLFDVMTEPDLEVELKVKPGTMGRMRRENRGPRYTKVGKLIRYPRPWVQEWLEKQAAPKEFVEARTG